MRFLPVFMMLACAPKATPDATDSGPTPPEDTGAPIEGHQTAVVATSDYAVGALATVSVSNWSVEVGVQAISPDAIVVADDGFLLQVNRSSADTLRVFAADDLQTPTLELAFPDGANVHDVQICGGRIFAASYEQPVVWIYDPATGVLDGSVDLTPYDDGDGSPEADTMVELGGVLYLSLNQLERDADWGSTRGTVLEINCSDGGVSNSWEVGPNPTLHPIPGDETHLLVRTGVWWEPDGALARLDVAGGTMGDSIRSESTTGVDLTGLAAVDAQHALTIEYDYAGDQSHVVGCLDLQTGAHTELTRTQAYLLAPEANDRGQVWVAGRAAWSGEAVETGLRIFDPAACSDLGGGSAINTVLEPLSVAFL